MKIVLLFPLEKNVRTRDSDRRGRCLLFRSISVLGIVGLQRNRLFNLHTTKGADQASSFIYEPDHKCSLLVKQPWPDFPLSLKLFI